jgi:GNAT superfamily N-acetyltransferase
MLKLRRLKKSEILQLKNFPPADWNLDFPQLLSFHFEQSYFYPAAAEIDKKIVGCGIAMIFGSNCWLGTIIVLPEYRGQGIGTGITSHLIEYCKGKGCRNQLLVASEMGEPVYRNIGFITSATYIFFKHESAIPIQTISNVRKIKKEDIKYIKELDKNITGEERFVFIERFLSTGWVYDSGRPDQISGVYLPDYGTGLVIAKDHEAGLALVKLRFNQGNTKIVIPESNIIVKDFLLSNGFQEYRRAPRMVLGEDANWIPSMVYNRGTGYCG